MANFMFIFSWIGAILIIIGVFVSLLKDKTMAVLYLLFGIIFITPGVMKPLHLLPSAAWPIMIIIGGFTIPSVLKFRYESSERKVLNLLSDLTPRSAKEIAGFLEKSPKETKKILKKLELRGKIKKDPSDKNKYILVGKE